MRRRLLVLLGGQAVALGLTVAFLVVPASAVFLHAYGASALPYAYLAVAVAGALVSSILTVAQGRMPLGRLALAALAVHLVVVAIAWVLLTRWDLVWVTFVLIVLFPLSIPTGFLIVGSQAVRLYDVRTLKRDFPRVVAGFSIGFAVGGLAAAALVAPVGGAANLLLIDIAAVLAMMTMVGVTSRRYPAQLLSPPSGSAPPRAARRAVPRLGGLRVLQDPLVLHLLGYQVISAGVTQLLDYIVWERAAAYYPDPHSLARFMGAYGAVINIVSVLFVVLLAGRLLSRRGVGFGLAANPAGVLVISAVVVAVGAGPGIAAFAYLVAVCAAQVIDISLTDGTTRTAIAATYQGVRRADRLRVQTLVEGAGVPLAVGLVGVFLLVVRGLGLDVRAVVWTTVLLSLVWFVTAIRAHRSYAAHLGTVLADRSWDPVALRLDADARAEVERLLASADPVDRRTALDALVDSGAPVVDPALASLSDADPSVRCAAIEALRSTQATERTDVEAAVASLLDDGDARVRARAGAVLAAAGPGGRERGRQVWRSVLEDPQATTDALAAAAALPSEAFVPDLVRLAREPNPVVGLTEALAAHGDHLVGELERVLAQDPPHRGLGAITSAVARGGSEQGRTRLLSALLDSRPVVADAAAAALARSSVGPAHPLDGRARRLVGAAVDRVLERVRRTTTALAVVDAEPLRGALADDLEACSRRLLTLAGVVVPGVSPERVIAGLASDDEATRALAEELVTVALGGRAGEVLGVVDPRRRASAPAGGRPEDRQQARAAEVVRDLAVDPAEEWADPWLRACALRVLPDVSPAMVSGVVAEVIAELAHMRSSGAAEGELGNVVRETLEWLAQLEGSPESRLSASASADAELP